MPTSTRRHYRFWQDRKAELQQDAMVMTNAQLEEKYQVVTGRISDLLWRLGIKRKPAAISWSTRLDELKTLAASKCPRDLAIHFGTTLDNIHAALGRYKIKAVQAVQKSKLEVIIVELLRVTPTITEVELVEKSGASPRTVRRHLARMNLLQPTESVWGDKRKAEIMQMLNSGMRAAPIAEHYGVSLLYLRKRMYLLGIKSQAASAVARRTPRQAAPQPEIVRRSVPKPAAPKLPVEIIVPADVKVTIAAFNPLPGMRICNGTQTQNYSPTLHGGVMRSMR